MPGSLDLWLLGSSLWSAAVTAAQLGMAYAFAHFIGPEQTEAALARYRSDFKPSKRLAEPRIIVALGAICADTEAEATRLSASTKVLIRGIRLGGERRPVPTPEDATRELEGLGEGADPFTWDAGRWPRYIVGSATQVAGTLQTMARDLRVDELMILTVIHDHGARRRSYELARQIARPRLTQRRGRKGAQLTGPCYLVTSSSSTSKTRVALGGITPAAP